MDKKSEDIRMTLNILKMRNFKVLIFLKEKGKKPFIAAIEDVNSEESGPHVILRKSEETEFPLPDGSPQPDTFLLYLKDIHAVDRYRG